MSEHSDDDCNPIERIAADFVERMRHGENPTVEDYASRHPEIAEDILELLPGVVAMEKLKQQKEGPEQSRFLKGPRVLKKLGDYLILGEIGRGGMGIVYEAEQQSLERRVAVKVLPRQSLLDERRLARFEREAQTAARLHHTNIVPIFGVGEQDGYHYYVMQFIRGLGLDRIVRELRGEKWKTSQGTSSASMAAMAKQAVAGLMHGNFRKTSESADSTGSEGAAEVPGTSTTPSPPSNAGSEPVQESGGPPPATRFKLGSSYWRSVARVGLQIADALNYAHSQGTLHRDIKPANLLLDAFGVVWVTDFGLAKVVEDENLTQSGDVVGTLQYMAPEQFTGRYDNRSDLYCLGLTLYELLTLQPAFAGSNRSGLMHKVTEGRPSAPRKVRPSIPADLETIVLKSINREPEHRYQSAEEMRADLQRFLEDRPIRARRANPAQQAWRWCRRNRALAAAILVAVLAVLGATARGWVNYVREAAINQNLVLSEKRTQDNLSRTLKMFVRVFDQIAGTDLFQVVIRDTTELGAQDGESETAQVISTPNVSERDAMILQRLIGAYAEFAHENEDFPELVQHTARAYQKIGDIHLRLGKLAEATADYHRAIEVYEKIGAAEYAVSIATVRNQLGQVFAQREMLNEARDSHNMVLAALADENGTPKIHTDRALYELARAHGYLGSWGVRTNTNQRPDRGPPGGRGPRGRRGESWRDRRWGGGRFRPPIGRNNTDDLDRRHHHVRAQQLFTQLVTSNPRKAAYRLGQARSCRNFYGFLWTSLPAPQRDPDDAFLAAFLLSDAVEILTGLAADFPDTPLIRYELAETLVAARPVENYVPEIEQALTIARDLTGDFPNDPSYAALLSRVLSLLGQHDERDPSQARKELAEAADILVDLLQTAPDNRTYHDQLRFSRWSLLMLHEREGDHPAALDVVDAILAEERGEPIEPGDDRRTKMRLVNTLSTKARILRSLDQPGFAAAVEAEAHNIRVELRRRQD